MNTEMVERLISSDDHADMSHKKVKEHLAAKYHSDYDSAVADFDGSIGRMSSSQANQRWREQQGLPPADQTPVKGQHADRRVWKSPAFGRAGHRDPRERLKDMDTDGVEASVTWCEVSAFRYLYKIKNGWKEATRAFNGALAEFASADPKRLVISYQIPIHDIDIAVDEVTRIADAGGKSLQLPVFPTELGLPDYWDVRYDPLWSAIQEVGLPIGCHVGMNTALDDIARRDPTPQKGIFVPCVPLSSAEALGMWIMGGVFARFPQLKVVFVEPGLAWVAWWLYNVDDFVLRQGYEFPAIEELPSHYFHRNVFLTFIDEPNAVRDANERLGIENVMWSSDYPHPVSSWPNSRAIIDRMFRGVDEQDRRLVLSGNAARIWNI